MRCMILRRTQLDLLIFKIKMVSYLTEHFSETIQNSKGDYILWSFFGKNIEFIPNDTGKKIIPDQIYGFMKKNAVFEQAFGCGVGEF